MSEIEDGAEGVDAEEFIMDLMNGSFILPLLLVFIFLLPNKSLANEGKGFLDYMPSPYGFEIGGGTVFVLGVEWWSEPYSLIYEPKPPENINELWLPSYVFAWTIRTRYIYDSNEHEHGLLLYPNIQYFRVFWGVAIGPQVGWFSTNGFDYGASLRLDLMVLANFEVGYLVNSRKIFLNAIFTLSIPRFAIFDP